MSKGDWRDMYNAQMAQSGRETSADRSFIAGKNLGLGVSVLGEYLKKHKGAIGKAYQKHLANFVPESVTGAGGQITMTTPQSFQDFARVEKDKNQRRRSYEKYSKRGQIDDIRKVMMEVPGKDYSEEKNQQPTIEQVKDYIHNDLPNRKDVIRDLKKEHRQEKFGEFKEKILDPAGKEIGGVYSALDKFLLSGISPGGHDPKSQLSDEGEELYQAYLAQYGNIGIDRKDWFNARAGQISDPKEQEEFRKKYGFKFKASGLPSIPGAIVGGLYGGGKSLLGSLFGEKGAKDTFSNIGIAEDAYNSAVEKLEEAKASGVTGIPLQQLASDAMSKENSLEEVQALYKSQQGFFGTPGPGKGRLREKMTEWEARDAREAQENLARLRQFPGQIKSGITQSRAAIKEENKQRIENMKKFLSRKKGKKGTTTSISPNVGFNVSYNQTLNPSSPLYTFAQPRFQKLIGRGKSYSNPESIMYTAGGEPGRQLRNIGFYHTPQTDSLYMNDPRFQYMQNPLINPNLIQTPRI